MIHKLVRYTLISFVLFFIIFALSYTPSLAQDSTGDTTAEETPPPSSTNTTATPPQSSAIFAYSIATGQCQQYASQTQVPAGWLTVSNCSQAPNPNQCTVRFSDVDSANPFYQPIYCLGCRNFVSGYSDGTFKWGNEVTRGQFSKMVANAAGFNEDPGVQKFQDVPPADPFYAYINRLANRNIIAGYTCTPSPTPVTAGSPSGQCIAPGNLPYFQQNNSLTRAQAAKFIAEAKDYNDVVPTTQQTFADVTSAHPFYLFIERLAMHDVMDGYACGGTNEPCDAQNRPYFRPNVDITRGQAAKVIQLAFIPNCAFTLVSGTPTPGAVTGTPVVTATPAANACPKKPQGDANCDGVVDNIDYYYTVRALIAGPLPATVKVDFNNDGAVNATDRGIVVYTLTH